MGTKSNRLKLVGRRTWLIVGYLVVAVFVILLALFYVTKPEQFGVKGPFIISCIASIFAGVSILVALGSLELARATVRPFLALQAGEVSSKQIQQKVNFEFHVKNTGSIPANVFSIEMTFFDDAELIEEDNTSKYYPTRHEKPEGVVIFPGAIYNFIQWIDLSHSVGKPLYDSILSGKVKLRFRVTYGAQGIEYLTVQTEKLLKAAEGQMERLPIQPQRWT